VKLGHRGTEAARQRAAREAAVLERLGGVHAPALFGRGDVAGRPYLVMERIAGATLEQRLAEGAAVRLREIGAAVAEAVAAVHAAGVVHGDLKPENVALGEDRAMLIDLGSAAIDGEAAPLGASVEYMAPELRRRPVRRSARSGRRCTSRPRARRSIEGPRGRARSCSRMCAPRHRRCCA
jgi:serine/threonine protein kinase